MKAMVTAVCFGSSLVGGTFAPTLFLGATAGAAFHKAVSIASLILQREIPIYSYCIIYLYLLSELSDKQLYAIVLCLSCPPLSSPLLQY